MTTGIVLLPVEASYAWTLTENRQFMHLTESVVIDAFRPDSPMAGTDGSVFHHLVLAFQKVCLEFRCRAGGEDLVEFITDSVNVGFPKGVTVVIADGVCSQ